MESIEQVVLYLFSACPILYPKVGQAAFLIKIKYKQLKFLKSIIMLLFSKADYLHLKN